MIGEHTSNSTECEYIIHRVPMSKWFQKYNQKIQKVLTEALSPEFKCFGKIDTFCSDY